MEFDYILKNLPYEKPFRFVDQLTHLDENGSTGYYQVREDEFFFKGHFPENPVVPGVIITEIMAQIGMVCLAIFLNNAESLKEKVYPAFTSSNIDFLSIASPGDTLTVVSKKIYFRFGKLKCSIVCRNQHNEVVAKGECSGMIINKS